MKTIFAFITIYYFFIQVGTTPAQQPIIGIYTQPENTENPYKTYIAASYIKNIQMAGAQVIPIFYHYSEQQLLSILGKINGVLFPGGSAILLQHNNQWTNNINFILQYAIKQNDNGRVYPIWATCLGFQALLYLTSGQTDITKVFTRVEDQQFIVHPLKFTVNPQQSYLFKGLQTEQLTDITNKPGIFFFNHKNSITFETYSQNMKWHQFWNLISTFFTPSNLQLISTIEAKNYPFYGTQYHPQKNSFQWHVNAIRTFNAISVPQKMIRIFINKAKLNKNIFSQEELKQKLIYNYEPTLNGKEDEFLQTYHFDESNLQHMI